MFRVSTRVFAVVGLFILAVGASGSKPAPEARKPLDPMVRLPGHVLPALARATLILPANARARAAEANQPLTLTIVLKRDAQVGFERYLQDIYDPHSKNFHHYLTQKESADRFGPSQAEYEATLAYLRANGFMLTRGSTNRLTITVTGTRGEAERAFRIQIADLRIGKRIFHANQTDPEFPVQLAPHIQTISGLSDLARPNHAKNAILEAFCKVIKGICEALGLEVPKTELDACVAAANQGNSYGSLTYCQVKPMPTPVPGISLPGRAVTRSALSIDASRTPVPWADVTGAGQKIGLVEFDTFNESDVVNYLALFEKPATTINQLSKVDVAGGVGTPGANQDEVLLDVDTTLSIAPGALTVVYDTPFSAPGASFQALLNAMLDDKVTIISNSWAYCEDETTLADVRSIDSLFQNAAVAGISVFNGSGDTGSACLDGAAKTLAVPADSPNATAVGGSSEKPGTNDTYGPESWWNDAETTPPAGAGGFGVSKFFESPNYQTGFNSSPMRSVPDVVVNADPFQGIAICEADKGGCPNGLLYGGTSAAAPIWAAFTALLNESQGTNLGFLNPKLYALAKSGAFHDAALLGSDFTHVGLGSPNLNALHLSLSRQTSGSASATRSSMALQVDLPANGVLPSGIANDGKTAGQVTVWLRDASGNNVSGKTVRLIANSGAHVKILPATGVTTADNGAVSFQVTDLTGENVSFAATDTTDGVTLSRRLAVAFTAAPAAAAALDAFPSNVTADGKSNAVIGVTLKDSLGRPSPGKLVQISQGQGNSVIKGPIPSVTDANGQVQFTAVDQMPETVTYSAVDVTDGNLPFPKTGTVIFTGGPANGCGNAAPPAAPGFLVTPYATGFTTQSYLFGDIRFTCSGAYGMAFDAAGNLYVTYSPTGDIYKFPPGGGVADSRTLLTARPLGPSLAGLAFDKKGNLFASRDATSGNFLTGAVLQIDPVDGDLLRTVAPNLTCPTALSVDPLSGDLFTDDLCFGSGSDNPSIWRINTATPKTTVYTKLPGTPNGNIAFAPSGNMYVWAINGTLANVAQVSGTNGPPTPTVSFVPNLVVANLGIVANGTQADGDAQSLFLNPFDPVLGKQLGIGMADLTTNPPSLGVTLATGNGSAGNLIRGPEGCIYAAAGDGVFKITDSKGTCNYGAAKQPASLVLSPPTVSPNPAQGTSQSLTASFHYTTAPAGTPVFFQVTGANPLTKMIRSDATGTAAFSYTAKFAGVDTISASATLVATNLTSNQTVITWSPGQHTSFLTLNLSPTSVRVGKPVKLIASLSDVSVTPPAAVPGASIQITLEGNSCFGTTDAKGNASCTLTPAVAELTSQTATFAGNSTLLPATATQQFNVTAPPTFVPTVTPKATATRRPTPRPTRTPSRTPTRTATRKPTPTPTHRRTATATRKPTPTPTPIPFVNFGVAVVGDDGTGTKHGLQVMRIEDRTGKVLPTPKQTYVPLTSSADIDGLSITADGTHGAVIEGSNVVHFFSSNLATGAVTVLPATVNVKSFGLDGDSIASLPGGDEVVVSAGGKTAHALISGVLSGKPVIAESIPTSKRGVEYDGVVISADGKVMLSRAGVGKVLDVYSVTATAPHPGPLGGTVAFSFRLIKTLTVPAAKSLDGREGMAISPINSSRAVLAGSDGTVSLITGLPSSPVIANSIKLSGGVAGVTITAVAISRDGKFAIVAISGGLVVLKGVDTGTLAKVGTIYSPTFATPKGSCKLSSPQTLGVMADGKFVVTIQDCGLPKSTTNVGSGVLLTVPFSGGTLGKPVGQLNFVVTPLNDQLLTH